MSDTEAVYVIVTPEAGINLIRLLDELFLISIVLPGVLPGFDDIVRGKSAMMVDWLM